MLGAIAFLKACMQQGIEPLDMLTIAGLKKAMAQGGGIMFWLPVPKRVIMDYYSWLGKDRDGSMFVALDAELYSEVIALAMKTERARQRAIARLMAVLAHEAGHIVMKHVEGDKFVCELGRFRLAQKRKNAQEWGAWLFAEILRGLVLADLSYAKIPDEVPLYV
jgi:hypothetical protein